MNSQLQNDLNNFFYGLTAPKELMDTLTANKEYIQRVMAEKDQWEHRCHSNLSEKQQMTFNAQKYVFGFRISRKAKNQDLFYRELDYILQVTGITLNLSAFLVTIQMLGDQQQAKQWKQLILSAKVIGGYAQTQLGHGSNVQGLQTQAKFNPKNSNFIINSPKVTSAKFWPGVLGQYSTHVVLQAKTYVNEKSIGIQTFIVQIRNEKLQPLNGIQVGDIGPKLGFKRVDNGYLSIKNIEIPLSSMLCRYIKVHKDGSVQGYENKQAVKYGYGSMLNLRVKLTNSFAFGFILFPTMHKFILYRKLGIQKLHRKQITQDLCCCFGFVMANSETSNIFEKFKSKIASEDFNAADRYLAQCHIISSTMKALSSWISVRISANSMTGNKYCIFNTTILPSCFINSVPTVTYEGDNSVLLQQTAKYIIMDNSDEEISKPNKNLHVDDFQHAYKVLKYICSEQIKKIKDLLQKDAQNGIQFLVSWNQRYQRSILDVAQLWGTMIVFKGLIKIFKAQTKHVKILRQIVQVFSSVMILKTYQIPFYGFQLIVNDPTQLFNDEEYESLIFLNRPISRNIDDVIFCERKDDWIYARI